MNDTFKTWAKAVNAYNNSTDDDPDTLLEAAAVYLERTADWPAIRDVMRDDLCWSKEMAIAWFSEQDFPDFQEALNEGWGWD